MALSVQLITRVEDLSGDDIAHWNGLAANPFLRWEWLGTWAKTYCQSHSLYVLKVSRDETTVCFAPWFLEKRVTTGRTIQFLGSGKVCTDHLSLLVRPCDRDESCSSLANWLTEAISENTPDQSRESRWDSIEWIGVDENDESMNCLAGHLTQSGLSVDVADGLGCYSIPLPDQWDDYVKLRSKSGRREIRQSLKSIDSGIIEVTIIETESELESVWQDFVDLHQRRRKQEGTTGCFDHPPFGDFLREAASQLLAAGLLKLVIARSEGTPVAAQFALDDETGWYFYQSGMDPDASELRPGLSVFCHSIRSSILSGRKQFDMLRGDEPYKLRWRAVLQPAQEIRVCSPRASARLRNQAYNTGVLLKNLVKSGFGLAPTQS